MNTTIEGLLSGSTPLLKPAEEQRLFQQLEECRRRGSVSRMPGHWSKKAQVVRERLVSANLLLIVAMAGRTRTKNVALEDLVAEGTVVITRAIEKFEWKRGYKFSTYATRALFNQFSRAGVVEQKFTRNRSADFDVALQIRTNTGEAPPDVGLIDMVDILDTGAGVLSEIELEVLQCRFGHRRQPETLHALGARIGKTKERIRQIQVEAVQKLREYMELDTEGKVIQEKF